MSVPAKKIIERSPYGQEKNQNWSSIETEYLEWVIVQIGDVKDLRATDFLRGFVEDPEYDLRLRYKAQELLLDSGQLDRRVLPPRPPA